MKGVFPDAWTTIVTFNNSGMSVPLLLLIDRFGVSLGLLRLLSLILALMMTSLYMTI